MGGIKGRGHKDLGLQSSSVLGCIFFLALQCSEISMAQQ